VSGVGEKLLLREEKEVVSGNGTMLFLAMLMRSY
jgi:hypothetical protein